MVAYIADWSTRDKEINSLQTLDDICNYIDAIYTADKIMKSSAGVMTQFNNIISDTEGLDNSPIEVGQIRKITMGSKASDQTCRIILILPFEIENSKDVTVTSRKRMIVLTVDKNTKKIIKKENHEKN